MKKLLIATLVTVCLLGLSTTASAFVLTPGTSGNITNTAPSTFGTSVISGYSQAVSYDSISGTLYQDVWMNSTGLLFRYQFVRNDSTGNALDRMTMTNFSGFLTDVDAYNTAAGEELPHVASRQILGDTISYQYASGLTDPGLLAGLTTAYMWIQTDAQYLGMGTTNFINGGVWSVPTYCPAVPEPGSMLLLGMGILGLAGLRRKT